MTRLPALAMALVLLGGGAAALWAARDSGVAWDESVQARYGELVLEDFRSGLATRASSEFLDLRFYGPPFEALAALAYAGSPERRFAIRHLLVAVAGIAGVAALMAFAATLGMPWLPPAAGLALLAMPRFFGHVLHNSKDVPFAAGFALAVAALAALLVRREPSPRRALAAGAALGLAAALRPGGLPMLAGLLAATLAARAWLAPGPRPPARALLGAAGLFAAALAVAWLVMVAPWPWALASPLRHPLEAMARAGSFAEVYQVLFEGRSWASDALPRRYLAQFLLITTPPALLALAAAGLAFAVREQWRAPREPRALLLGLAQLWLLAPLLAASVARPNVYDGLRHFLFVLPALALFAGFGACALVSLVPGRGARRLAAVAAALALASALPALVRLHPYQYAYFNAVVGGLSGAEGRYETEYWATSYREAMAWIEERARERGEVGPLKVWVAANAWSLSCAQAFASERVALEPLWRPGVPGRVPADVDYYLSTTRFGLHRNFPRSPVVHEVGRDGAIFAVVKQGGP